MGPSFALASKMYIITIKRIAGNFSCKQNMEELFVCIDNDKGNDLFCKEFDASVMQFMDQLLTGGGL